MAAFTVRFNEHTIDALVRYQEEHPDKTVFLFYLKGEDFRFLSHFPICFEETLNYPHLASSREEAAQIMVEAFHKEYEGPPLTFKQVPLTVIRNDLGVARNKRVYTYCYKIGNTESHLNICFLKNVRSTAGASSGEHSAK